MNASQVVISTDVLNDGIDAIWMTCQHVLWGVQGINFSPEQSRGHALVFTVNNESWCLKKKKKKEGSQVSWGQTSTINLRGSSQRKSNSLSPSLF